ncbi:YbbR-like domain-containing protein [Fictibacillus iocasae]|uniref:YbbR-like domain-containing protein n=1 Tax=Fictibacillus iocasae TaxID=2715437 RepID=A0ABW2NXT5_9BACL
MDKLLNSNWFVKIIAFLLALMLAMGVSMETEEDTANKLLWTMSSKKSETLNDISIVPYFDQQKYVLTDMPASVDVRLSGPASLITKTTKVDREFEVYIDLTKETEGPKKVKVKIRNVPKGLTASVEPSTVNVTLHKKVTKDVPVNIDLKNIRKLPSGYSPGEAEFSPKTVRLTGAEDIVNDISFITGFVDVSKATETIETNVPLKAYNSQGDVVDVLINPETASVKVPINKPKKNVSVSVKEKGQLPEGLRLNEIIVDTEMVMLTGPQSLLDEIDEITAMEIDLSKITKDTSYEAELSIPEGVKATRDRVKVTVDVEETKISRAFRDVPLTIEGLASEQEADILDPVGGVIDIEVTGKKEVLDRLTASDFKAVLDVSGLDDGEHAVKVRWSKPAGVTIDEEALQATVAIKTKTTSQ